MKRDYNEKDIKTASIAESVCRRPKLCLPNGTIEEVYAYLRGCNDVIMRFGLEEKSPTPQDALNWIYGESNNLGGGLDLAGLRSKFGSDEATLASLLESIQALRLGDEPLGDKASPAE
ncbi:hypothetical protein DES53_101274 [Roseimicrobium gellanilyticum]|uniref:Uncharacterized protein n=1 Tax=Roseimicrobium gellanilyticum TaxID=748857 RepID=A0A366HTR5_9BACT|nr:hypothetical protein [Roseimicrobium gellanilyticum]RBP47477.1 hypothetical protein DES53_101274 [Roseimicrobium gellanilyticum]